MENSNVSAVKINIEGPYWLTRDKQNGVLSDTIEVWLLRPTLRKFDDGDVMWLPALEFVDVETTNFAEWSIAQCIKECYTYPATERECIRVG